MTNARSGAWIYVGCMASVACQRSDAPTPPVASAAPSASPSAAKDPLKPPARPGEGPDPGTPVLRGGSAIEVQTCRAIAVRGVVTTEGGTRLVTGGALDRPIWIDLAAGADLAVKHAKTSRELVFHGPARVLPCAGGEERFLLARGRVTTATWAGARPGAEVLLATPLGVVRYGDARLEVRVDDRGLSVRADAGDAWIDDPGPRASEAKVSAGGHAERPPRRVDVKALVDGCDAAARTSEARARDVLSPAPDRAPLGERAADHVRARRTARAACAVAAASLGTLEMGRDRDDLEGALARSDSRWRGLPAKRDALEAKTPAEAPKTAPPGPTNVESR